MAIPTQGGLGQASVAQAKPAAPVQAGGKFDVNAVQANNLDEISNSKTNGLRDVVSDELGDQREALNSALVRMRASLDDRKNRMIDPALMQAAAGFLKPTKTGSFGESLGYAAEGYGTATEREMLRDKENQKMEMELFAKEQELRRQMGGDRFLSALVNRGRTNAPPPASGAVASANGELKVPGSPVAPGTAPVRPTADQVIEGVKAGRIPLDDETILLSERIDPKLPAILKDMRRLQLDEDKNILEKDKLKQTTRKVRLRGSDIERDMTAEQYDRYEKALNEYLDFGDAEKFADFQERNNLLEPSQVRGREPKVGGKKSPVPAPMSAAEREAEQAQMVETQKIRAKASEDAGNEILARGRNATKMEGLATDVLSLTDSNTRAFNLMQNATVRDSLLRAIEQGASVTAGPMTVALNLPVRVALQGNKEYQLTKDDITALQLFQQKQSEITAEMRKMSRSPGEGATDKAEGQLYAAIGVLPSDSARALALKSEAMIQYARYNARAADLWSQYQDDNPNKSFTSFQRTNPDYKELQSNYVRTLNDMREKNADVLRTSPKKPTDSQAPATSSSAPTNETPLQKFKREKAEREARGGQ